MCVARFAAGDAKRESVLRKLDLRFGVGRWAANPDGRGGMSAAGWDSRNLWLRSRISLVVRVSVRLCVGSVVWVLVVSMNNGDSIRPVIEGRRTFDVETVRVLVIWRFGDADGPRAVVQSHWGPR